MIAKTLAEALDDGDEAHRARALAVYRQAAWGEDMDALSTIDPPEEAE